MGIADSLMKGSFELNCPLSGSGKTERSYARITDKNRCERDNHGEQKGNRQKNKQKRYGGNYRLADRIDKACFCLLLSQPTKVSAHRTGEHTMKA